MNKELSDILEAIEKAVKDDKHLLIWKETEPYKYKDGLSPEVIAALKERGFILKSFWDKEDTITYYICW